MITPGEHLQSKKFDFPQLGLDSFATFLKVCENFAEWALDDIGLSNRADSYKVWVCWVKAKDTANVKEIIQRYSSMKLLSHYYDCNIVENNKIGLYVKLDYFENKWNMSYGITNNKTLFKVGSFDYTFATKLPDSKILKYITEDLTDFDPRAHVLMFKIKKDMVTFDPGYCKISDPQIIDKEIVTTTNGLGLWNDKKLQEGEADKYLEVFKNWVKEQKWWDLVHLIVRPRANGFIDFVLKLK